MVGLTFIVFLSVPYISAIHGHYLMRWINDGGICKTSYGEVLNCVHLDSCYPKYNEEPENRPIVCGIEDSVTLMCCVNDDTEDQSNGQNLYPKNLSIIINQNFPCLIPIQNPSNTESKQSNNTSLQQPTTNNSLPQEGQQIEENSMGQSSSNNQSGLAEMVAQNPTINFPFYRPSSENSTSFGRCKKLYEPLKLDVKFPFIEKNPRPNEYTHMALLGYGEEGKTQWLCSGSLISEDYVLTAAHCRTSKRYGPVKLVRLGAWDLRNTTKDVNARNVEVGTFISHPLYVHGENYHDIAIIKLDRTIYFTTVIKPACVATTWDLQNVTLNVTGWGLDEPLDESPPILQTSTLQYVSSQRCQSVYENAKGFKTGINETLQICAGGGSESGDICQGDSGGPLQFTNTFYDFGTFPEIVGIASSAIGCDLIAGVYTRVLPYVSWIEGIVWPRE